MIIDMDRNSSDLSLSTILVNDFGDSYHRFDNEPSDELEKDVRKIRRRYRVFGEFQRASSIYVEYMDRLSTKYGGSNRFTARLQSNTVYEYLPPKPKLKKNTINDFISEHKVMISDPGRMTFNSEQLEGYENEFDSELTDSTFVSSDIIYSKDKILNGLSEDLMYGKVGRKNIKEIDALDLLASYFDTKSTSKGKKQKEKDSELPSVIDILDDNVPDDEDEDAVFFRGRYMTRHEVEQMKLYQDLSRYGWNSLALMKQHNFSNSSAIVNVLKDEKYKKKRDKMMNKKKKKGKSNADEFLIRMMGDNDEYETFGEYEEDMLNATINSVFK